MFFSRPQGIRTTCNYRKIELYLFGQLYGRSALIAPIIGTVAQRSYDVQYLDNIQHVL